MLKNYLKTAFRSMLRRKGYTLINVLGLSTGMAICLLIVLFIQSELQYDTFQEKGDRIYRMSLERKYPGRSTSYAIIPQSIGEAVVQEFPEVEAGTRMFNITANGNYFLRIDDKVFEERRVFIVDSNFFELFTADFLHGNPVTALARPNTAVISETTAKRLYGSAATAIGKTYQTNNGNNSIEITGIVKDWPDNSHFLFDMLLTSAGNSFTQQKNYISFAAYTYLLLKPGASPTALEAKFRHIIDKYVAGPVERNYGQTMQQFEAAGNGYKYFLQAVPEIHLTSNLEAELRANGSLRSIYIFSIIAIFILTIACINFINLSTARSVERSKEVGIRKTLGSERKTLVLQFLVESVMTTLVSITVAFGLILLLLPVFNQVSGKSLTIEYFLDAGRMAMLISFAFVVGLVAGLYPAFVLSSFKPILVLKGKFKSNKYGLLLRNGLVVFQFAISVVLIIATIIVNNQMQFMLGEKLGFRKDHIVTIERTDLLNEQTLAFKTELSKIPGVEMVSSASAMPGTQQFFGITVQQEGANNQITGRGIITDENYASLLALELKEGRFFSDQFSTDTLSVILNEKAVEELGLQNPVGTRLTTPQGFLNAPDGSPYVYSVVGVLKDFHFQSLHQQITPLVFINARKLGNNMPLTAVRIQSAGFGNGITAIENTWKKFVQQQPFHFRFLDQTLTDQYHTEQTTQRIFTFFSALAIFIACIGLLGLAAYATQQRTREISIRKVLGADVNTIVMMLSKDFLKLVLIAALVAYPVGWWTMHAWLDNFEYRTSVNWTVFVIAGLAAVVVALCTISYQAIRAALTNPVKNLRSE